MLLLSYSLIQIITENLKFSTFLGVLVNRVKQCKVDSYEIVAGRKVYVTLHMTKDKNGKYRKYWPGPVVSMFK